PQVRQQLSVCRSSEVVALRFEGSPLFRVFEEFAIEDDPDTAVFISDRLPSVGEADNTQPAGRAMQPVLIAEPVLIRPSIGQRSRHRRDGAFRRRASAGQIDPSRDAAHLLESSLLKSTVRSILTKQSFCPIGRVIQNSQFHLVLTFSPYGPILPNFAKPSG